MNAGAERERESRESNALEGASEWGILSCVISFLVQKRVQLTNRLQWNLGGSQAKNI